MRTNILHLVAGLIMLLSTEGIVGEASNETASDHPVSPQDVRPLIIGARIPDIALRTVEGASFDLDKAIYKKPTVLIFYRGGWCPYCNTHLAGLREIETQLIQLGYQIIAVSPDRPDKVGESLQKHNMNYLLLSDSKMAAATAFGIAYKVDDETLQKYSQYGIDLENASSEKHHLLPVPSVFIIGGDGTIKFHYVNPDYKVRIDPELLLTAARAVLK